MIERPSFGRLAWLDELRAIAIFLMVVDHALLFFLPNCSEAELVRCTLTRSAEPLFVFVLTAVTIYLGRPMRPARWLQILGVSLATSTLLSYHLGYFVADILASLAIAALILPIILKLKRAHLLLALYGSAALSILPMRVGTLEFDYSVMLVLYQMLLARLVLEQSREGTGMHALASSCVVLLSSALGAVLGFELSIGVFIVFLGHPLAAVTIWAIRSGTDHRATAATRIAARPLAVYACHLVAFAALANY